MYFGHSLELKHIIQSLPLFKKCILKCRQQKVLAQVEMSLTFRGSVKAPVLSVQNSCGQNAVSPLDFALCVCVGGWKETEPIKTSTSSTLQVHTDYRPQPANHCRWGQAVLLSSSSSDASSHPKPLTPPFLMSLTGSLWTALELAKKV